MGGTLAPTAPPAGIAGTGIAALQDAPAPPPESFKAYAKQSEESNGVMAMIDLLVKDLDKETTAARAQCDFIALTLRGEKAGLEKAIKMIDEMVANLKAEQVADDGKKEEIVHKLKLMLDTKILNNDGE